MATRVAAVSGSRDGWERQAGCRQDRAGGRQAGGRRLTGGRLPGSRRPAGGRQATARWAGGTPGSKAGERLPGGYWVGLGKTWGYRRPGLDSLHLGQGCLASVASGRCICMWSVGLDHGQWPCIALQCPGLAWSQFSVSAPVSWPPRPCQYAAVAG